MWRYYSQKLLRDFGLMEASIWPVISTMRRIQRGVDRWLLKLPPGSDISPPTHISLAREGHMADLTSRELQSGQMPVREDGVWTTPDKQHWWLTQGPREKWEFLGIMKEYVPENKALQNFAVFPQKFLRWNIYNFNIFIWHIIFLPF